MRRKNDNDDDDNKIYIWEKKNMVKTKILENKIKKDVLDVLPKIIKKQG